MRETMEGQQELVLRGSKCQDCGNQAKKECSYSRCRTCCKNKGFHCQTHIKSTWTPVDRKRHKNPHPSPQEHNIPQNHNQINPYSGGLELKFPAMTNSMAIFRCVEVRSMDGAVNQIAYQTCVNIGGHVFSGLLYDQGPADQSYRGESSSGLVDQHQNLGLVNNASINFRDHSSGAGPAGASASASASATVASAGHDDTLLTPFHLAPHHRPGMPYFTYPRS